MKKAQMEILGLMIVIILMIVGILFGLRYVITKEAPETKQEYTRSQLTSNFGTALLQTTTEDCRGVDMTELLTDCAEYQTITCGNGQRSCEYAYEVIDEILNKTFDIWNVKYYLNITRPGPMNIFEDVGSNLIKSPDQGGAFLTQGCNDNQPGNMEEFFLPTDVGLLTLRLFICR